MQDPLELALSLQKKDPIPVLGSESFMVHSCEPLTDRAGQAGGTGRETADSEEADVLEKQLREARQEEQGKMEKEQEAREEQKEMSLEEQLMSQEQQEMRQEEQEMRQEQQEMSQEAQDRGDNGQDRNDGKHKQHEGLPPGYCLLQEEGNVRRILTPPTEGNPKGLRIRRIGDLRVLHSKGQCLELKLGHLNLLKTGCMFTDSFVEPEQVKEHQPKNEKDSHDKELGKLKKFSERLGTAMEEEEIDHKAHLDHAASLLNNLRKKLQDYPEMNRMNAELIMTKMAKENPLNCWPPDPAGSIFASVVEFGCSRQETLISLLLLTLHNDMAMPIIGQSGRKCVIEIGHMLSLLQSLSSANRNHCNSIMKANTVVARSAGITHKGLDFFSRTGSTLSSSAYLNLRNELVVFAEDLFRSYAKRGPPNLFFDNIRRGDQQMTQPCWEFQLDGLKTGDGHDLSLEDTLELFKADSFFLDSAVNHELLEHLWTVVEHLVPRLWGDNPDFLWVRRQLPQLYPHKNTRTAAKRSVLWISDTLPLDENDGGEMITMLEIYIDRYLEGVEVSLPEEEREEFRMDVKLMKSPHIAKEVRRASDERVFQIAKKYGLLWLRGDLLTLERIKGAKDARARSDTRYECLDFVKLYRMGMWHAGLNKLIIDYHARLKDTDCLDDPLSLATLASQVGFADGEITNDRDKILQSYEIHCQFIEACGKGAMVTGLATFKDTLEDGQYTRDKEGAKQLVRDFLQFCGISFYCDRGASKTFRDDMEENSAELASRYLLQQLLDVTTKHADSMGTRAMEVDLIPFFLNRGGDKKTGARSKYVEFLMHGRADYMRVSSEWKAVLDRYIAINTSGKAACGVAADLCNEHLNFKISKILEDLEGNMSPLQIKKSVLGLNMMMFIDEQHRCSAGFDSGSGGGHSTPRIKAEQLEEIQHQFDTHKPFSQERELVNYSQKCGKLWEGAGLEPGEVDRVISLKQNIYMKSRFSLPF